MIALLLSLAVIGAQDPDARLKELLLRFQDDSIEVREKAGAELFALGEAVLQSLKEALPGETNAEVRGRIRGVVDRIETDKRRREFKSGKAVNGLAASLEGSLNSEATEFALTVRVMNLNAQPAGLVLIDRWNSRFPNRSSSSSGSEAAVVIRQLTGERGNRFGGSIG